MCEIGKSHVQSRCDRPNGAWRTCPITVVRLVSRRRRFEWIATAIASGIAFVSIPLPTAVLGSSIEQPRATKL